MPLELRGRCALLVGLIAALGAVTGCASVNRVAPRANVPVDAVVRTFEVTASKYRFDPEEIRVKRGTVVRLNLRSLDTEHGIAIPRYGIDRDIPEHGKGSITVEFYAREMGSYSFHCSNFCGLGHFGMKGQLVVEE